MILGNGIRGRVGKVAAISTINPTLFQATGTTSTTITPNPTLNFIEKQCSDVVAQDEPPAVVPAARVMRLLGRRVCIAERQHRMVADTMSRRAGRFPDALISPLPLACGAHQLLRVITCHQRRNQKRWIKSGRSSLGTSTLLEDSRKPSKKSEHPQVNGLKLSNDCTASPS